MALIVVYLFDAGNDFQC